MADDPRIAEFNAAAKEAQAAIRRARTDAEALDAELKRERVAQRQVSAETEKAIDRQRVKRETVADEPTPRVTKQTQEATQASRRRAQAVKDEDAAMQRLNRTSQVYLTEQQAIRRMGPFGGGEFVKRQRERYFGAYGPGGPIGTGGYGPAAPPPGGFRQLGPGPTKITSQFEAEARAVTEANARVQRFSGSLSALTQVQAGASQQMRRHGLFTTEFIQAAGRGEVTIRELGFQVAGTIAKFGGWLIAGTAVYGAAAAMGALATGALDAFSGVTKLHRVITSGLVPSEVRQSFRDLSGEFNLPIDQVSEAAYQMGKRFHDQNAALEASRAVLYSVKVGELDVATATRYLIAIVSGFDLPASRMATVFDQINAAQNRFGASIEDVEAGLAKSSGAFRAAGGDFNSLLAIITTAQRVTGNTGQVIGTAVARAPNFLAQAANQQALREFGITPSQDIDKIIEQAFKQAQHLSGRRLQELAGAIFGPQYGQRVGVPLLQNFELYQKVLARTSPAASQGSAQKELQTALSGVDEQITRIGISLQRLGAGLAEAHFFDFIGGFIKGLNFMLDRTIDVVEAFNDLPDILKRSLIYMTQLAFLMRGLQRLGVGEAIARPGIPASNARTAAALALGGGERTTGRLFRGGLYREQAVLQEQLASGATRMQESARKHLQALEGAAREQTRVYQLSGATEEGNIRAREEAAKNVELFNSQADAERKNFVAYSNQVESDAKRLEQVNTSMDRTRRRALQRPAFLGGTTRQERTMAEVRRTGGDQFYPSTFDIPTTKEPVTDADRKIQQAATRQQQMAEEFSKNAEETSRRAEETMKRAEVAGARAESSINKTKSRLASVGAGVSRFVNAAGTLLFGVFIFGFLAETLKSAFDNVGAEFESIETAGLARSAEQARKQVTAATGGGQSLADVVNDVFAAATGEAPLDLIAEAAGRGPTQLAQQALSDQARVTLALRLHQQNLALQENKPVPFRYTGEITKDAQEIVKSGEGRKQSLRDLNKLDAELRYTMESLGQAAGSQKAQRARLRAAKQAIDIARASVTDTGNLSKTLERMDPKTLDKFIESTTNLLGAGATGYDAKQAARLDQALRAREKQLAGSKNVQDLETLAVLRQNVYQALEDGLTGELDQMLKLARSPADRLDAARTVMRQLRQRFRRGPTKEVERQEALIRNLRQQYREGTQDFGFDIGFGHVGGETSGQELKNLRARLHGETLNLRQFKKNQKDRAHYFKLIQQEIREQNYEINSAVREARLTYAQSTTADPLRQARLELDFITRELPRVIKIFGRDSQEFYALLQRRQAAIQQAVDEQYSLLEARLGIQTAGIQDPIAKQRKELANLEQLLAFMQAHSDRYSPSQIADMQRQIAESSAQLAQDAEDEAEQIAQARIAIQVARAEAAGHSVRAAALQVKAAELAIQQADTPLERLQAQEQKIQAVASKRDAVTQARLDTINFEAEIGKITTEQEIRQLENLLHTYKLSLEMRRQIRTQIHSLRDQMNQESDSFELNVGDIQLPTAYDIRRAIVGGLDRGGRSGKSVTVDNRPTVVVNNYGADAKAVGRAVGQALNTSAEAAMRSAGVS